MTIRHTAAFALLAWMLFIPEPILCPQNGFCVFSGHGDAQPKEVFPDKGSCEKVAADWRTALNKKVAAQHLKRMDSADARCERKPNWRDASPSYWNPKLQ
jgi:hypothetical protein